ncbi:MAG: hypothetical protein V4574_20520 [Pseudomonadota bacterium]
MAPAEFDQADVPAGPLALATALSGVPVTLLLVAFYQPWLSPPEPLAMIETTGMLVFAGMGPACLVGVPIALLVLRDPDTSALAWAMAGLATALIAVAAVGFWNLGLHFPFMLFTFLGPTIVLISLVGALLGALSGLIARLLLALLISRRAA